MLDGLRVAVKIWVCAADGFTIPLLFGLRTVVISSDSFMLLISRPWSSKGSKALSCMQYITFSVWTSFKTSLKVIAIYSNRAFQLRVVVCNVLHYGEKWTADPKWQKSQQVLWVFIDVAIRTVYGADLEHIFKWDYFQALQTYTHHTLNLFLFKQFLSEWKAKSCKNIHEKLHRWQKSCRLNNFSFCYYFP